MRIDVYIHTDAAPPVADPRLDLILAKLETIFTGITTMSASISAEIDSLTAKFQADVNAITTEISGFQTQIADLTKQLTAGSTVTQAQVDALAAIETRAAALATPVVVTPPAPPAP